MREDWKIVDFEDSIEKIKSTIKIHKKNFLLNGKFPIISQEDNFINGYWDKKEDVFKVEKAVVIFGDHTKKIKYVDFDFVLGADGVKILLPIKNLDSKFFAYQIKGIKIRDLGYARHFRILRENSILIPPLPEQKQIVTILDQTFEAIDQAKANLEKNIENAKELFDSKKEVLFEKLALEYEPRVITEACLKIFAGGDAPKNNYSKERTEEFNIPIIANAVKNNGLYGYTNEARVTKPSINYSSQRKWYGSYRT